ncbi:MAG TPA: COX15/CtaA family protein [Thermoanaerobaculaceae bacterium]|nr:COX15/CtaA family protein [Thermoanaerobaculaceae bacterium]HPS77118.1 COX15/CtaA family protein [Thermoanaerobaculaceae bacterium]
MDRQQDGSGRGAADILAVGFGTAVAMWVAGYVSRLPGVELAPAVIGPGLLAILLAGGFTAGRLGQRGWRGGLASGLLTSALNLLILGGLLASREPNQLLPSAVIWLPGCLLIGAAIGAIGGRLGGILRPGGSPDPNWTGAFAWVAAAATLALLAIGGLVTSHGAGLAVTDWPNSFGYNMFLYPLSRMTGGVYFEHAHRLFGALVGLTTVTLTVHLWLVERRRWLRWLALATVPMVAIQGLLGGLRVTGKLTLSTQATDMAPSLVLAAVHGVLGQIFFVTLVAVAVMLTRRWTSDQPPAARISASGDRVLGACLVGTIAVQLGLGALQRHLASGLMIHITAAAVVAVLAVAVGLRAWGFHADLPPLPWCGKLLIGLVSTQVGLGLTALVARGGPDQQASHQGWRAIVTTMHQTTGALLLGAAVATLLLGLRLTRRPADGLPISPAGS